jgi:uncharacterized membrane protein YjgN (DUF898 family)
MSDAAATAAPAVPVTHRFEFRGSGGEFFGIWIVNMVLTLLTLGIYSAWAKVRTTRYFYGNTYLADHAFEYHASPVRILIGRLIAITLLLSYTISVQFEPRIAFLWILVFLFAMPWLVVSSLRFAARNSSYRTVRFNFIGTMGQAAYAYILWPVIVVVTLGLTAPLGRRVRDYFYVNNHTFGGKAFRTEFSAGSIYVIYLTAFGLSIVAVMLLAGFFVGGLMLAGISLPSAGTPPPQMSPLFFLVFFVTYIGAIFAASVIPQFLLTMVMNLTVRNTELDGRHRLLSDVSPWRMSMIVFTNLLLLAVTLGFYYPWARVRVVRYQMENMGIIATTNLDEFTSEAIATQSAIGEEIAGFFDLGIGL